MHIKQLLPHFFIVVAFAILLACVCSPVAWQYNSIPPPTDYRLVSLQTHLVTAHPLLHPLALNPMHFICLEKVYVIGIHQGVVHVHLVFLHILTKVGTHTHDLAL